MKSAATRMVEAAYIGPTEHRGSRVRARLLSNPSKRVVLPWEHELSPPDNHERAAVMCANADVETGERRWAPVYHSASTDGAMVFAFERAKP